MIDLVLRQLEALHNAAYSKYKQTGNNHHEGEFTAYDIAIQIIEGASWKPISTHPDKQLKEVILFNKHKVQVGLLWGEEWVNVAYERINPQPTHWMPLPSPPMEM